MRYSWCVPTSYRKRTCYGGIQADGHYRDAKAGCRNDVLLQSDSLYNGDAQYMHGSGVTEESFKGLASDAAVKTVQGEIMRTGELVAVRGQAERKSCRFS